MIYMEYKNGDRTVQVPLYLVEFHYNSSGDSGSEMNTYGYINGETVSYTSTSVTYAENTIVEYYYLSEYWTDDDGTSYSANYNIYRHYILTVENQYTASERVTAITDLDNNVTWKFTGDFLP